MLAVTAIPGQSGSLAVREVPDPTPGVRDLLVRGLAVGVCGTDKEIADGNYGWTPPGQQHLVIGHESLGIIEQAPLDSGFSAGDLVVGVVRRPDPVPCGACAHGEFDMCRNGRYQERGIKELDGYGSQRWCVDASYAVRLDPGLQQVGMLLEPTSVVAKAWEQIDRIGQRGWFDPQRVLITGAGPIGLLAALIGAQKGLDVHVLDQVPAGPKPELVAALGATYHHGDASKVAQQLAPEVIIEATGVAQLVVDAMAHTAGFGITCLTGVSPMGRELTVDAGALNRSIVLENDVIVGSVNANLRHYRAAADVLASADLTWLQTLISRRVPLHRLTEAFTAQPDDVKVIITLDDSST